MKPVRISNETRVIGAHQGYIGLSLRDETVNCAVNGEDTPCMTSEWSPSEVELAKLMSGRPVRLRILGTQHPPVMLDVE